ncbi:MAG: DUF1266 domain-containing protein [Bacteroidia bacterium]|nr:DUF1266 domain-containing protein [Bacteroidia bacterium]
MKIDGTSLLVTLGGLLFLWLAWRGIVKKKVVGGKGNVKDTKTVEFYGIITGYILVGISLLVVGLFLFHQVYGWQGPAIAISAAILLIILFFQANRLKNAMVSYLKKPFEKQEEPVIQANAYTWALATVGMLSQCKGLDHETLGGKGINPLVSKAAKRKLKREWEIEDEEDLENTLQWLMDNGHRHEFHEVIQRIGQMDGEDVEKYLEEIAEGKYGLDTAEEQEEERNRVAMISENRYNVRYLSFLAWDYLRLIDLTRQGFVAGFIKEKDAWDRIISAAQVLQARYESWRDMGQHFLYAREFWSAVEMNRDGNMYQKAYKDLLNQPDSPWNLIEWGISLYKR